MAKQLLGRGGAALPNALAWRLRAHVASVPSRATIFGSRGHAGGRQILLVSHDLSRSGAPELVLAMAKVLIAMGDAVTVASPTDGGVREALVQAGATVLVSEAIRDASSPMFVALAGAVDAVICNTVVTQAAVEALGPKVPLIWYVHEVSLLEQQLAAGPHLGGLLSTPARVWVGSELPASLIRPHRPDVKIVPYGLEPLPVGGGAREIAKDRPLKLAVFGSFEPRKGQDLLLEAMRRLAPEVRRQVHLTMFGRVLIPEFHARLCAEALPLAELTLAGELDRGGYCAAMLGCDAVVVPSRDDTLPLVSLDALGAGRLLICTQTTGTAAYLTPGQDGFVAATPTADTLAATLTEAVARADDWPAIAEGGRQVFARNFATSAFAAVIATELAAIALLRSKAT